MTTHPIQYQVPWFRRLAAEPEIDLTVFFCQIPDAVQQGDGFGVAFEWDIPLLDGYRHEVLKNVARQPSVTRFAGCDTPEVRGRIREGGFDAFVVNGWVVKSCLQALRACRKYRVPCIVRGESNAMRRRSWWKRLVHRALLWQFAALLTIGRSNADFYRGYGITEDRLFPAHYFIDNDRFAAASETLRPRRAELRERWGIPADKVAFLFCGKFIEKKYPLELIRAVAEAHGQGATLHLLMVGDGELRPACERYVAEHDVPVTFAGFMNQSELPAAYAAADCLVLPSDSGETWGLVVNEAMACGLPAVVSDQVGCWPDLIREGKTGTVFPFGDWPALAACLRRFAEQPEATLRMGQNSREHVAAYSVDAAVRGTMEAIRFVAARGKSNRRTIPRCGN